MFKLFKGTGNGFPTRTGNTSAVFRPFPPTAYFPKTRQGNVDASVRAILQDGTVALESMTHDPSQAEKMRRQMLLVLPALQ